MKVYIIEEFDCHDDSECDLIIDTPIPICIVATKQLADEFISKYNESFEICNNEWTNLYSYKEVEVLTKLPQPKNEGMRFPKL